MAGTDDGTKQNSTVCNQSYHASRFHAYVAQVHRLQLYYGMDENRYSLCPILDGDANELFEPVPFVLQSFLLDNTNNLDNKIPKHLSCTTDINALSQNRKSHLTMTLKIATFTNGKFKINWKKACFTEQFKTDARLLLENKIDRKRFTRLYGSYFCATFSIGCSVICGFAVESDQTKLVFEGSPSNIARSKSIETCDHIVLDMWERHSQQNVVYETRLGGGNLMNSLSEWVYSARNNPDLQAVVSVSEVISMEDIIFIATGSKLVNSTQREESIRNTIRHHTAGLKQPLNVLVTGRYGSGKSRTINSILNVLLHSNLQYTYYIPETGERVTERFIEYDSQEYNLVFYDTMGIDQTPLTNNEKTWINMAIRGRLQPNVHLTSRENYVSWFQKDVVAKKIDVILHVMETSKMDEHLEIRKQIVQLAKPYQVQVVSVFTNSKSSDTHETKKRLTNFPQLDPKHTYFIENDELLASVEERVQVLRLMEYLCRQGATRNLKKKETDPNAPVSFGEESSSCCVM